MVSLNMRAPLNNLMVRRKRKSSSKTISHHTNEKNKPRSNFSKMWASACEIRPKLRLLVNQFKIDLDDYQALSWHILFIWRTYGARCSFRLPFQFFNWVVVCKDQVFAVPNSGWGVLLQSRKRCNAARPVRYLTVIKYIYACDGAVPTKN
jgi:hypothetical protein